MKENLIIIFCLNNIYLCNYISFKSYTLIQVESIYYVLYILRIHREESMVYYNWLCKKISQLISKLALLIYNKFQTEGVIMMNYTCIVVHRVYIFNSVDSDLIR